MNFGETKPAEGTASTEQKYSIQKLSLFIDKFLKVLEIDLGRLHQHRRNIEKVIRTNCVSQYGNPPLSLFPHYNFAFPYLPRLYS